MKIKKIFMAMLVVMLVGLSSQLMAGYLEERYIREEASRRNMKLLTYSEAQEIAEKQIGRSVRLKDIDLENKASKHSGNDFRPVYELECIAGGQEYEIRLDAVTGEILKFEIDD